MERNPNHMRARAWGRILHICEQGQGEDPKHMRARAGESIPNQCAYGDKGEERRAYLGNLLVVLLEGSQVLAGLAELALLHALADVPVHEGALGVHEVELVVQAGPGLGDGRGVGQHAHGPGDLGKVAAGHHSRGLVVDADLCWGRERNGEEGEQVRLILWCENRRQRTVAGARILGPAHHTAQRRNCEGYKGKTVAKSRHAGTHTHRP